MKKKGIVLFFILNMFVFVFGEDNKEIIIEKIIKIEDVLKFSSKLEGQSYNWDIIESPLFSEADFKFELSHQKLIPDVSGKYKIRLTVDGEKAYFKTITVNKKIETEETKIYERIVEKFRVKDESLFDEVEILKRNYPNSSFLENGFKFCAEKAFLEKNYVSVEKYLKLLYDNFKFLQEETEEILLKLYEVSLDLGKTDVALLYLDKLLSIDEIKYLKEKGLFYLKAGIDKELGIKILKDYYSKTLDSNIGEILGDYYSKNNSKKSILYYKNNNNLKYSIALQNSGQNVDEAIINLLSDEEKKVLNEEKENLTNERKMNGYYKKANDNLKNYKFEIAEVYYKKIIEGSKNEDLAKNSYFNLARLYYLKKEFKESFKFFNKYIDKYGSEKDAEVVYFLSMIHYKMKNYDETKEKLNEILLKYPNTVWESKAKVYMLKINKEKEI